MARGLRANRSILRLVKILEDRLAQSSENDTSDENQISFLPNIAPMRKDTDFHKYMTAANEALARSQIQAYRHINETFAINKNNRFVVEFADSLSTFGLICTYDTENHANLMQRSIPDSTTTVGNWTGSLAEKVLNERT